MNDGGNGPADSREPPQARIGRCRLTPLYRPAQPAETDPDFVSQIRSFRSLFHAGSGSMSRDHWLLRGGPLATATALSYKMVPALIGGDGVGAHRDRAVAALTRLVK